MEGARRAESGKSLALRQQINLLFPEVDVLAHELDVDVTWQSYPAPSVGGPIIPVNILLSVIDQNMGHGFLEETQVLDVIDRAIGTAETVKRRTFRRMMNPLCWPIDVSAFVIRIPFLILRKAGLPASVEENVISQVLKVLIVIGALSIAAYLGLQEYVGKILNLLGK